MGGGGYVFQTRVGKGGIIFTSNFFGGSSFETLHCFKNHRPPPPHPWDVINDRSLVRKFLNASCVVYVVSGVTNFDFSRGYQNNILKNKEKPKHMSALHCFLLNNVSF